MSVCCQKIINNSDNESPFHRVVALGYYDGPTDGITQCAACQRAYRFDLLAWDEGQDVRVFAFAPIRPEDFQRLVEVLAAHEEPRWPVWAPSWRGDSRAGAEAEVAAILGEAGRYEFALVTRDLGASVLTAKKLEGAVDDSLLQPDSLDSLKSSRDWLSFIGIQD